jgi:Abnormal spindle-like microcephaly-assoc'd, ASPM-SPD-2-Hydin
MTSSNRPPRGGPPGRNRPWAILRSGLLAGSMLVSSLSSNALLGAAPARAQAAPPPANTINNPPAAPHQILVFPQRDFVSASGYAPDDLVVVSVTHPGGATFSTDPNQPITPQADPRAPEFAPFAGIVEVNHPGGACWFQTTPDIRPGDAVRITIVGGPRAGQADETIVANVTAQMPVEVNPTTISIHGTAQDALGHPLPLDQLEQRLVANRQIFLANGRRVLTTAKDGTLAYDPVDPVTNPAGINWTATYTGLPAADVTRALGAESRILWLGANPLAAIEGTIFEKGAGVLPGPAAPCTAPLEVVPPPPGSDVTPPSAPSNLAANVVNSNSVKLTWTAATDNVGVTSYGVYRDGLPIFNVENPDGSAPAPTAYDDVNVPPGTYTYTVDAADAIGNRSTLSNTVSVTTAVQLATLPAGVTANEPPVAPVQIISFPSRDFVSNSGFLPTDTVQVQVLRKVDGQAGLVLVSTSTVTPQPDPRAAVDAPFAGIVEVNHPGGGCWDGVTPDIRVGDIIRTIAYNPDGSIRTVDQSTTANVVAERPRLVRNATPGQADGVIEVHGVAMYHDGTPMDLSQFENRLIANRDLFVLNHRRVIRAGGAGKDGVIAYDAADPTGTHWTATYSGLVQQDVDRALGLSGFHGAESRALWLGAQPLAGLELTIYENAADPAADGVVNGPSAGVCPAPSEPFDTIPPAAPTLNAVQSGASAVQLTWSGASDNVAVYQYGVYADGKRIRNVSAATTGYLVTGVAPGPHAYAVDAVDAASPAAQLAPTFTFSSPWGNRSAQSAGVSLTQADVTAPSVPANLVATAGVGTVSLSWTSSTDDVGVTSYGVYRGGTKIADVAPATGATQTFSDSGLAVGTYTYSVDAADAAANRSAQSAAASVNVTQVPDTSPPTAPTNLTAATAPDIHGKDVVLTWSAASDDVGVTSYGIYRNGARIADVAGSTLSYTDRNLAGGTYLYTVDAADSAANRSPRSAEATAVVANDPPLAPHSIVAFPQRDFISATGFALSEGPVTVSVLRQDLLTGAWKEISRSDPITPQDDPKTDGFDGLVEVNHPGGGCWQIVTPDLRPGDLVRYTTAAGIVDQTTVARVTTQRGLRINANTIQVHGTAQDAFGQPLPVAATESRLVANRDLFDFNGKRLLRAGGAGTDGTLVYDAPGSINWTATYTGLDAADMDRILGTGGLPGSEFRAMWLGRDPLALTESTIYENGDGVSGGPAAAVCAAPAERAVPLVSFDKPGLTFADQAVGTAATTQTIRLFNVGTAPMTIDAVALVGANPADFSFVNTCPSSLAASGICSINVTFKPTAAGSRVAGLDFQTNGANVSGFVPLSGNATAPVVTLSPASLDFGGPLIGSPTAAQTVMLTNTGTAPLTIASVAVSGANATDFTLSANTCPASPATLAVGANCSLSVVFEPSAAGARTGSLDVVSNAGNGTQSVALSGHGTTPAAPTATITDPKPAPLSNTTSPSFSFTASDAAATFECSLVASGKPDNFSACTSPRSYLALADGTYTFKVRAINAGGTGAAASYAFSVDTVAPVATAPVATLSTGSKIAVNAADFKSSTLPVTLTWSATDANTIASYQLQQQVKTLNGTVTTTGVFADVTPAPSGTSVTLDLPLGQMLANKPIVLNSYTFKVRACDKAGNCGAFATAPTFQLAPIDDSLLGPRLSGSGSVAFSGTWFTLPQSGAYNDSMRSTSTAGSGVQLNNLTFTVSTDVAWVAVVGPDRGIATVSVDGGPPQTVDLYSPTPQIAQVVWTTNGLKPGVQHSIKATATGTRRTGSTGNRVDFDGFMAIH